MTTFLDRVDQTGECWLWLGNIEPITGRGRYGQRWAHRVSYELFVGAIDHDHDVHHRCENKLCVRPDHLELLTKAEHMAFHRGDACLRGHAYTEHGRVKPNGAIVCRECDRLRGLARRDSDDRFVKGCAPEIELVRCGNVGPEHALALHLDRQWFVANLPTSAV